MEFWVRFGIILLGMVGITAVWWGLKRLIWWFRPRTDDFLAGMAAATIIVVLGLALLAAGLSGLSDDSGRCGPGTRRVVDRVFTGKGYVTEYVCVVDLAQ